jgi:hypothetical protein
VKKCPENKEHRVSVQYRGQAHGLPFPPPEKSKVIIIDAEARGPNSSLRAEQLCNRRVSQQGGGPGRPSQLAAEPAAPPSIAKKGTSKSRRALRIATLNTTTLKQRWSETPVKNSRLDALVNFAEHRNLELVCVQEHRIRIPGEETKREVRDIPIGRWKFVFTSADARGNGGVGILIAPHLVKEATPCSISHNIIKLKIPHKTHCDHIYSVYSPHSGHPQEAHDAFAAPLIADVAALPANTRFMLAGDFNAPLLLNHRDTNRRWVQAHSPAAVRLRDLLASLRAASVCTVRTPRTPWTFTYPQGWRRQLDHICLPTRWATSAIKLRSVDPPLPTLHRAVIVDIRWRYKAPEPQQPQPRLRWDLVQQAEVQKSFTKKFVESMSTHQNNNNSATLPLDKLLTEVIAATAVKVLHPDAVPTPVNIGDLLEVTALAHGDLLAMTLLHKRLALRSKKATYQDERLAVYPLQALHRRRCFEQYNTTHLDVVQEELQLQIEKFERLLSPHPAAAFRALNSITAVKSAPFQAPGATAQEQQAATLKHFKGMGGDLGGVTSVAALGFRRVPGEPVYKTDAISAEELEEALQKTAGGRAPGVDEIPAQVYKIPEVRSYLLQVLNVCYENRTVPPSWYIIKQVPIPKKGDLTLLANWRPICLLNSITKIYNRVLLNRISAGTEPHMRSEQSGFRRFRSVEEQQAGLIHILSSFKRLKPENYALIVTFLDFAKAFPSTSWISIQGALEAFKVPEKLVSAIMSLYRSASESQPGLVAFVQTPEFKTDSFDIVTGTLQGDTLAPYLFVLVLDRVLDAAFASLRAEHPDKVFGVRLKVGTGTRSRPGLPPVDLTDLDFADDIALFTVRGGDTPMTSEEVNAAAVDAQLVLTTISQFAQRANLFLKPGEKKTAVMVFGAARVAYQSNPDSMRIEMQDGGEMKQVPVVEKYKYLGRTVDHSPHIGDTPLSERVRSAWAVVHKLKDIWHNPKVMPHTRQRLLEIFVRPCLVFSSTTWIAKKVQLARIDSQFTRMRRYALQLPFTDPNNAPHATPLTTIYSNERRLNGYFDLPSTTVVRNSLRLLGHTLRPHDVNGTQLPHPPLYHLLAWEPMQYGTRQKGGIRRSIMDAWLKDLPKEEQRELLAFNLNDEQKTATGRGIRFTDLLDLTADRENWRCIVDAACNKKQSRDLGLSASP